MPELAEVETVRRTLKKQILNHRINNINILYPNIIENDLSFFKNNIINHSIIDISRKGKYLIFNLDNNYSLISHLRMEGKYFIKNYNDLINKHEHLIFEFDNFDLRYHDTRKFGRLRLIPNSEIDDYFSNIGPDANQKVESNYLYNKIHKKDIAIKTLLLDQSIIAGLGNIYVDEVLYKSKINPERKGKDISLSECQNILENSKEILDKAIKYKGTTIRSYTSSLNVKGEYQKFLKVHTKEGKLCSCGTKIIKIRINGRSSYYCPTCQK